MIFAEKLQVLRKNKGYTQEELGEKIGVSRQAIAKWESGQGYPDIANLIVISNLFHITVDYLVKDQQCNVSVKDVAFNDIDKLIEFRLEANKSTYAGYANQCESTRPDSVDFSYKRDDYTYHDTYVGGEQFAGEEAVFKAGKAVYAMNYMGRVLDERFSGDFLKEALRAATIECPYRGPRFYQSGNYIYSTKIEGDINWFRGFEEIFYNNEKVYECCYHGGLVK